MSCSGVFQTGFQPRLLLFGSCLLCYCLPHPVVLCLTPLSRQLVAPSARQPVTLSVQPLVMFSVWWLVTFMTRQPATPLVWQSLAPGADNPVTLSYYLLRRCICVASYYIRYRPGVVEATNAPPFPLLSRSVFSSLFLSCRSSYPVSTPRSFPFFRRPPLLITLTSGYPPPSPPLGEKLKL